VVELNGQVFADLKKSSVELLEHGIFDFPVATGLLDYKIAVTEYRDAIEGLVPDPKNRPIQASPFGDVIGSITQVANGVRDSATAVLDYNTATHLSWVGRASAIKVDLHVFII
jgi:hypothetical protein